MSKQNRSDEQHQLRTAIIFLTLAVLVLLMVALFIVGSFDRTPMAPGDPANPRPYASAKVR